MKEEEILPIGTDVEIINYGHLGWIHKSEAAALKFKPKVVLGTSDNIISYDMRPDIIGTITKIRSHTITQDTVKYALEIGAWYNRSQLKKLSNQKVVVVNTCDHLGRYTSYRFAGVFTDRIKLNSYIEDMIRKRQVNFDVDIAYIKEYTIEQLSKSLHFIHLNEVELNTSII